ncbi:MAG: hypothetical protein HKN67_10330, partial [Saprospiraceae bacterium]|nr:hypothetical protein [Saprospiraceae bacterium]
MSNYSRNIIVFLLLTLCRLGIAQCDLTTNIIITDTSTTTLNIEVAGILNNDLASPAQGLCGIILEFTHSYVGDIQIDLISPAGESVTLVGPFTSAISPTNLTNWTVTFVPCSFPASPDPGFSDNWQNDQAWQILGMYSGTYYPFMGCLDSLDSGPVNGTWSIQIIDNDAPQTGELLGAQLIFCDDQGLECNICAAYAGIMQNNELLMCEGETLANGDLEVDFPDGQSNSDFNYTFVLSESGNVISNEPIPDVSALIEGVYSICGLSYLRSDSTEIFDFINSNTLHALYDTLNAQIPQFCADISEQCITLRIGATPDTVFLVEEICRNQSFDIGDQSFSSEGIHIASVQTSFGCDSVIVLDLSINPLTARIAEPDTIACASPSIMLDGSSSDGIGAISFQWSTTNGQISGTTNQSTVEVNAPGIYTLVVNDGTCSNETSVEVIGDAYYPQMFLQDGIIGCDNQQTTVKAQVFPVEASLTWETPIGQFNDVLEIMTSTEGLYILTAMSPAGCQVKDTAIVLIDTIRPTQSAHLIKKNCINERSTVRALPINNSYMHTWTGPNSFSSNNISIFISDPGEYQLEIVGTNGCIKRDTIFIDDYSIPDLNLSALDSVKCSSPAEIVASSTTPNINYLITGPQGFESTNDTALTYIEGMYFVEGEAENGCIGFDTVEVFLSEEIFSYSIIADSINCLKDSATIGINSPQVDFFIWNNGIVDDSLTAMLTVYNSGTYGVELVDTQLNCRQFVQINVFADVVPPNFRITGDEITCGNPSVTLGHVPIQNSPSILDLIWETPTGNQILGDSSIVTSQLGIYTLTAIGSNGCMRSKTYRVSPDTIPPELLLGQANIGCFDSIQIMTLAIDSIESFDWSGPSNFTSSASEPFVFKPGIYTVNVTGPNGCMQEFFTSVDTSFVKPELSLIGDTLTCSEPDIILEALVNESNLLFEWADTSGLLSTDSTVMISNPGWYYHTLTGPNGCDQMDSLFIDPPVFPEVTLSSDTITCEFPVRSMLSSSNIENSQFVWSDINGVVLSTSSTLDIDDTNTYFLTVTGPNGCGIDTSFNTGIDTLRPTAIAFTDQEIKCQNRVIQLDGSLTVGSDLSYAWTSLGPGVILSNGNSAFPWVQDTGRYVLEATLGKNGC